MNKHFTVGGALASGVALVSYIHDRSSVNAAMIWICIMLGLLSGNVLREGFVMMLTQCNKSKT